MKKGLFDLLLDQILKERDVEESKAPVSKEPVDEEAKTLEEQAKAEVKKREKKRLDELLKKKKVELQEKVQKAKRMVRSKLEKEAKVEAHRRYVAILESPTKSFEWKCVNGNGDHLQAMMDGTPAFELKRGAATFKLRPLEHEDPRKNMLVRMENAKAGNISSSTNVLTLKSKAERILAKVLDFENKESAK